MTRSDIFTPLLKPIFWAAHMLPIYRQHDGEDTKTKNEAVFNKCKNILKYGRSLLVFSEGFTDNTFIRRLKPIKKGAVRIGFVTLENINWEKKIYLQAVGVNYSDPDVLGSDCLISNGEPLCLNDYKEAYLKDPNRTIYELTLRMEKDMQNQLTDVRNKEMAPFHENIMRITRKGMHAVDTDRRISLVNRWKYSKNLADWLNSQNVESNDELMQLKLQLEEYFAALKKEKIEETPLFKVLTNKRRVGRDRLQLIATFPIMILGLIHAYLPYFFIKNFVEKSFKRRVFWSSVKMMLGFVAIGLFNIPIIILMTYVFNWPGLLGIGYFLLVLPLVSVITYEWFRVFKRHNKMKELAKQNLSAIALKRREVADEIKRLIPLA